jgi:hypothetical protein
MATEKRRTLKERYVFVTDRAGNEFVCRAEALKKPEALTEEEKAACYEVARYGPH